MGKIEDVMGIYINNFGSCGSKLGSKVDLFFFWRRARSVALTAEHTHKHTSKITQMNKRTDGRSSEHTHRGKNKRPKNQHKRTNSERLILVTNTKAGAHEHGGVGTMLTHHCIGGAMRWFL